MNKKTLLLAAVALGAAMAAMAQPNEWPPNVSVSVGINQPGVYGQINIGTPPPPPALVVARPVIITPVPAQVQLAPIYLYVPPGHQKHWARHCHEYNACGRPVYFVREQWVRERYVQEHPGWRPEHRGRGEHEGRGDRDGRRDHDRR